jgi:NAD+ kinase
MGKVVVVSKKTAYSSVLDGSADLRVRELIARGDSSVKRWRTAHAEHIRGLEFVCATLKQLGAKVWVVGPQVAFDPSDVDLVVTVGGDGTLLSASRHVAGVPVLGVNSVPHSSIGFFCAGTARESASLLREALKGRLKRVRLTRMAVDLGARRVSNRVLNEALFCHLVPAATSRYVLSVGSTKEEQRSSGVWVGTAAGSTGALRSAGGRVLPLQSRRLQAVVREPYRGEVRPYALTRCTVESGVNLTILNKMGDARLYLDGPHQQFPVLLGETICFSPSDEPLTVLGLTRIRKQRSK